MNRLEKIAVLMSVLGASTLMAANNMRSPINSSWGHMHWPLQDVRETWWYQAMDADKKESNITFHKWVSLFSRTASKAFQSSGTENVNTTNTKKLGTLIFGKESFKVEESVAGGIVTDANLLASTDPFLAAAQITPDFDYSEKGVNWGGKMEYALDDDSHWTIGFAAHMPFKIVEVEQNANAQLEETLQDMFKADVIKTESSTTTDTVLDDVDLTIRLDLLRALSLDESTPLLREEDGRLKIGPNEVTVQDATNVGSVAGMFLYKDTGKLPVIPYRKTIESATAPLASNGLGATDGTVAYAVRNTGYSTLFNNRSAQANWWLVLRQDSNQLDGKSLTAQARAVAQRILYNVQLADLSNRSAVQYIRRKGLDLSQHERVVGLGDLDLGLYLRYMHERDWFVKLGVGAVAPTGTKKADGLRVYQFQTGNNRHWEIDACLLAGWMPLDWMSVSLGGSAHHVFGREEQLPASFTAATVKNLGPLVDGKVSWDYFTGHANFSFFHPYNKDLGCVLGYQVFAKLKDRVSFDSGTSIDFLGRTNQVLDSNVAEMNSSSMLHKVRGEIFHRWNFFELFAGASHAFAGKNAMKETEVHTGFSIYF